MKMMFCGDDTALAFKDVQSSIIMEGTMRNICFDRQETRQHGLGLVLKAPKRDFNRISILSRRIANFEG